MELDLSNLELSKYDKERGIVLPSEITENLAYLCGILAGDGSIGFRPNKYEYSIKCVGNPKDEKMFYLRVIGPKFKVIFGLEPNMKYHDSGTTFGFVIFSKSLVNYLTTKIKLPLGKKYNSLRIPFIFSTNKGLVVHFIRGLFDTDGCICFKKGYKPYPYYPVISLCSKSNMLIRDVAAVLKDLGFKILEVYDYKTKDNRIKSGFTTISRIDLNGYYNLNLWNQKIGFYSPKHLEKIKKYGLAGAGLPDYSFEPATFTH